MSKSTSELELLITAQSSQLQRELATVDTKLDGLESKTKKTTQGTGDAFGQLAAKIGLAGLAIGAATKSFELFISKESALADFSALTGVSGAALERFGNQADELARKFGTNATEQITAFKGILGRFGPDLAQSEDALRSMTDSINVLANASGLTAAESMDALTTTMLQFGIDTTDAAKAAEEMTRIMNVLAAGAKEGAAEVPQLNDAMKEVGITAHNMGLSIEETVAFLEAMATGGKVGSEAGIALRNVFTRLIDPTEETNKLMEKFGVNLGAVRSLFDRGQFAQGMQELARQTENIGSEMDRAQVMAQLFGKENMAAGQVALKTAGMVEELTLKVTGTNTAYEQNEIIMNTTQKRWDKFTSFLGTTAVSAIDKFKASLMGISEGIENLGSGSAWDNFTTGLSDLFTKGIQWDSSEDIENMKKAYDYATKNRAATAKELKDLREGKYTGVTNAEINAALAKEGVDRGQYVPDFDEMIAKATANTASAVDKLGKAGEKATGKGDKKKKADIPAYLRTTTAAQLEYVTATTDGIADIVTQIDILSGTMTELPDIIGPSVEDMNAQFLSMLDEETTRQWTQALDVLAAGIPDIAGLMGSAIIEGTDALKQALKVVLNLVVDAVEGIILAAAAASAGKAITSFGLTLIKDAPLLAAAYVGLEIARGFINSFAVGTMKVPYDQTANIHKGEIIVPAPMSESIRRGEASLTGGGAGVVYRRATPQRMDIRTSVMFDEFARSSARAMSYNSRKVN